MRGYAEAAGIVSTVVNVAPKVIEIVQSIFGLFR